MKQVTAVVVAFGEQALLPETVKTILASRDVEVDVILVDNGCTDGGVDSVRDLAGVTVIDPGRNLGLDEACNLAIAATTSELVALVNFDAAVDPDALSRLVAAAVDPTVGIATASLRLYDQPDRMNSAGNEVHFLGFSWCGGLDQLASEYTEVREVASASGAAMVMRRDLWNSLGGFPAEFFMYYEDPELSLRCWRAGYRVVFVPDAVVLHRYEAGRNPEKMYLVERNRLITMLTVLEARTLVLLMPAMLGVELAMVALSWRQGWLRGKLRGWWWLVRHRNWLRARRATLAGQRVLADSAYAHLLATHLLDANLDLPAALEPLDTALAAYWKVVRVLLRR